MHPAFVIQSVQTCTAHSNILLMAGGDDNSCHPISQCCQLSSAHCSHYSLMNQTPTVTEGGWREKRLVSGCRGDGVITWKQATAANHNRIPLRRGSAAAVRNSCPSRLVHSRANGGAGLRAVLHWLYWVTAAHKGPCWQGTVDVCCVLPANLCRIMLIGERAAAKASRVHTGMHLTQRWPA